MSDSEAPAFAGYICRTLDRIVATLDGLDADALNWRPPAKNANSLCAIAMHTLANAEENVLGIVCEFVVEREYIEESAAQAASA
jgi:hypothetical protein